MGRSLKLYLAFVALLGWSGCLLFTDPINKAPMVTITGPDQVTRGQWESYYASPTDEDGPATLTIEWTHDIPSVHNGCDSITLADWVTLPSSQRTLLASTAPYPFKAPNTNIACVCVRVTDHYGASGQSCMPVTPSDKAPEPVIVDVSGAPTNKTRALCSQIELSAESSVFPPDDEVRYDWSISYSGSDPNGSKAQLAACADYTGTVPEKRRCFYAGATGSYVVSLSITDTTDALTSQYTATFTIPVAADAPPCLQRTDPDAHSQLLFLSPGGTLGTSHQSRTLSVLSAADDCEPYPVPDNSGKQPTQFLWSVQVQAQDNTKPKLPWKYQADATDSYTVSQVNFNTLLPGDSIKVRVEARDAAVQKLYQSSTYSVCDLDTEICCGPTGCTGGANDCIRWTTWTVQF